MHKNLVFPNYKQNPVMCSLGGLNCQLLDLAIKSSSSVSPGNSSIKVTTSAKVTQIIHPNLDGY
jgi:hypothetical protein